MDISLTLPVMVMNDDGDGERKVTKKSKESTLYNTPTPPLPLDLDLLHNTQLDLRQAFQCQCLILIPVLISLLSPVLYNKLKTYLDYVDNK